MEVQSTLESTFRWKLGTTCWLREEDTDIVIGAADAYYEDVLHTAIVETEGIINTRPLTAVSDDPDDVTALTPITKK